MTVEWIEPDWPAPTHIRALSTTRRGGVSTGVFAELNLGDRVGDDPEAVAENRRRLVIEAGLPAAPGWLRQVHGVDVAHVVPGVRGEQTADAAIADRPGAVCAVLTADCLPVLFTSRTGNAVAVAHAGWRGLAAGVLEAVLARMPRPPAELLAWIGPGIGPDAFEVGPEVRAAFVSSEPSSETAFRPGRGDRWLADLPGLARQRLESAGLTSVYGAGRCTFSEPDTFFSHRRDGRGGRMATLIWISPPPNR